MKNMFFTILGSVLLLPLLGHILILQVAGFILKVNFDWYIFFTSTKGMWDIVAAIIGLIFLVLGVQGLKKEKTLGK